MWEEEKSPLKFNRTMYHGSDFGSIAGIIEVTSDMEQLEEPWDQEFLNCAAMLAY